MLRTLSFLALALAVAGCDSGGSGPTPPPAPSPVPSPVETPVMVASAHEVGTVGKPATVAGRDGAQSALVGGRLLWIFGDTFFATRSVDGTNYRTNTATLADPARPLVTTEPLDANGVPLTALALTPAELAYNAASGSGTDRVAVWNAGLVADAARGSALGFYESLYTKPTGWQAIGIGTARFGPGQTTGTRAPGVLFDRAAGEPLFKAAMLHDGTVYLYGALSGGGTGVAKAALASAETRSAYTFWTGSAWSSDIRQTGALTGVPADLSVAWNAHLGRFVGVSVPFGSRTVTFRTAARPEGPWSAAQSLFETRAGANGQFVYAATQHPALARDGGKTIAVSYSLPTDCFLCGEVVVVDVTFG